MRTRSIPVWLWGLAAAATLAACDTESAPSDAGAGDTHVPGADTADLADTGAGCALTGTLTLPGTVSGRLAGDGSNATTTCTPSEGTHGPEHRYALHLDAPTTVTLTATSGAGIVLAIRTDCGEAAAELACATEDPPGTTTLRRTLDAGDYVVLVDVRAEGIGGDYTLTTRGEAPSGNGTCGTALRVTPDAVLSDQRLELGASAMLECDALPGGPARGPGLYYVVSVPSHARLSVHAALPGPAGSAALLLYPGCPTTTCLGGVIAGAPFPLVWDNLGDAAADVIVAVAQPIEGLSSPPLTLSFSVLSLPEHAICERALGLAPGASATGDAFVADLYHRVTMPPRSVLQVRRPGGEAFRAAGALRIEGDCATHTVLDGPPAGFDAVFRSTSAAPREVLVVVGGSREGTCTRALGCDPSFEIVAEVAPLDDNATCDGATALPLGATVVDLARGGEPVGCPATPGTVDALNASRYYAVRLAPGETLHASMRADSSWTSLGLVGGCGGTARCDVEGVGGFGQAFLAHRNTSATPEDVVLATTVAEALRGDATALLETSISTSAEARTACATAPEVTADARFPAVILGDGTDSLAATCAPGVPGPVLYFPVAVPAGLELYARIEAAPAGGTSAFARLLSSCGATSCLDARPAAIRDGVIQLTRVNASGATEHVVLAVGTVSPSSSVLANVEILLRQPRYAPSTIPARCDDLSAASPLPPSRLGLPFSFSLFGDPVTHLSAATNGYAQLWPDADPFTPPASGTNVALPSSDAPTSLLAPLWTGLYGFSPAASVTAAAFGTAPSRRLTVGWSELSYAVDPDSRLTFQVQLYEATNVIELHYCSLVSVVPEVFGGGTATIGVQDRSRTRAALFSHRSVGAVTTGAGVRFTPLP